MKIHQLKYIYEVASRNLNVSEAADALFTSQPGVSKQIRLLEEEIGVTIFARAGKRLTRITPAGEQILGKTKNILREIESIKLIGEEFKQEQSGTLTIATTHTQARYALPNVIRKFVSQFPKVKLFLKQGYPEEITRMVVDGDAEMVIATEAVSHSKELVALPCYQWNRCALTLPGHPLLELKQVTLADIAQYPILTYDFAFAGRTLVSETFEAASLQPNIVFTALDSDVIKTYVELGLGVGLVAKMAFDPQKDLGLRMIDLGHLFPPSIAWVGLRKNSFLRSYVYRFIEQFAPHLDVATVKSAVTVE
ncbi:MAG: CysB family HTH-type transcriptional regulator [Gammaproteobacteria bacterium]|nr:CysB family HTH-type transcriptional regulator [Gammaproteobacteria bacterium]